MLKPIYLRQFEKEVAHTEKRGKKIGKLRVVIKLLLEESPLPQKYRNHKLKGKFDGFWECHIESDWLLIYKKTDTQLFLVGTGSHSDLFE